MGRVKIQNIGKFLDLIEEQKKKKIPLGNIYNVFSKEDVAGFLFRLNDQGFKIVQGDSFLEIIDMPEIYKLRHLRSQKFNYFHRIMLFKYLESTNDLGSRIIPHLKENTIIVAQRQTKGKGRRSNQWYSPTGGLWFSLVLKTPCIDIEKQPVLNYITLISAIEALQKVTSIPKIISKWPNDIYLHHKKLGGIMIEGKSGSRNSDFLIIGVGLNTNVSYFPSELNAISCLLELGKTVDNLKILEQFIKNFENYLKLLLLGRDHIFLDKWLLYNNMIGKFIKIRTNGIITSGYVYGFTKDGGILIREKTGIEREVISGEVVYYNE